MLYFSTQKIIIFAIPFLALDNNNMRKRLHPLLSILTFLILASAYSTLKVYDLTCEGLRTPISIDSDFRISVGRQSATIR